MSGRRTAAAPSQRQRVADPARQLAYEVLREVADADAYSNLVLPPRLRQRGITGRDARFTTELTYGTLRLQGRYDAVLAQCVDRPLADLDQGVLLALRLGAHQLLGMRVPPHAAVSATVALARANIGAGPAQLINAVLRRVAKLPWDTSGASESPNDGDGARVSEADCWRARVLASAPTPLEGLAAAESHPAWIVRAFQDSLAFHRGPGVGAGAGELPALLAADNIAPKVTLALLPGLATSADLRGLDVAPGRLAPPAYTLAGGGDPGRLRVVREHRAIVQDEGSQLVTLALADAPIIGPDRRWMDMCAGPGGKAALLAALAAERGATLLANEVSAHRAELVRSALAAIPPGVVEQVRVGDARDLPDSYPGAFDRVLLDAPCTGLGALRRRPEARWRKQPSDVAELRGLQVELLRAALLLARPGGLIGYVTCSPHLAETTTVVADALKGANGVEVVQEIQLWPHVDGTDAMFCCLLRKAM